MHALQSIQTVAFCNCGARYDGPIRETVLADLASHARQQNRVPEGWQIENNLGSTAYARIATPEQSDDPYVVVKDDLTPDGSGLWLICVYVPEEEWNHDGTNTVVPLGFHDWPDDATIARYVRKYNTVEEAIRAVDDL